MKEIRQGIQDYHSPNKLQRDLKAWFEQHPFSNGFDAEFEYFWAQLTDEDAFAFVLKHPEYLNRFTQI
jgi:hypothetical protein